MGQRVFAEQARCHRPAQDTARQPWVLSPRVWTGVPARTLCEGIDSELPGWALGQVLQGHLGLALADHQVHDDEALEDNGPCRVAQAVGEGAKDLGDSGLARVGCDEDVLDIL